MGSKDVTRPRMLKTGSRVALLAPASPLFERDDLTRGQELCRALGYEPVLYPNAGRAYGYLAGTDDERLADLNAAFRDPALDAVWCLRGGYGMTRILPRIDYKGLARAPKAVIGYSDITAMLAAIYREIGLVTFHGPVAHSSMSPFSRWHFDRILTTPSPAGRLGRVAPPADVLVPDDARIVTLKGGVAEGRLLGGNLSLLQCLLGTKHLPDFDGAILFMEDVGEALYRVDRMLSHLRMAGVLDKLAGVIVGQFTEMEKGGEDGALGFDEVLATYFLPLGVPVAYGFPFGHVGDKWTLPLGVKARLDADAGELEVVEPAVS
jgi:muramoyltetrapeptide carboxypeptidase